MVIDGGAVFRRGHYSRLRSYRRRDHQPVWHYGGSGIHCRLLHAGTAIFRRWHSESPAINRAHDKKGLASFLQRRLGNDGIAAIIDVGYLPHAVAVVVNSCDAARVEAKRPIIVEMGMGHATIDSQNGKIVADNQNSFRFGMALYDLG